MPHAVGVLAHVSRAVNAARVASRAPPPKRVVGTEVVKRALEMAESHSPAKLYRPMQKVFPSRKS